jgi:hypothetical protein
MRCKCSAGTNKIRLKDVNEIAPFKKYHTQIYIYKKMNVNRGHAGQKSNTVLNKHVHIRLIDLLLGHAQPFRQFFRLDKAAIKKKICQKLFPMYVLKILPLAHALSYPQELAQFFLLGKAAIKMSWITFGVL